MLKILISIVLLFSVSNSYTMGCSVTFDVGELYKQFPHSIVLYFETGKPLSRQPETLLYHLPEVFDCQKLIASTNALLSNQVFSNAFVLKMQNWVEQLEYPDIRHLSVFFNEKNDFNDCNRKLQSIIVTLIARCSGDIGTLESKDGVTPLLYLMAVCADGADRKLVKRVMNSAGDPLKKGYLNNLLISPVELAVAQKKWNYAKLLANKAKVSYGSMGLHVIFGIVNQQREHEGLRDIPSEIVAIIERFLGPSQNEIIAQCARGEFIKVPESNPEKESNYCLIQ